METPPPETPENSDTNSTIDASRPFHSVKEAVAVFGTRLHPASPVPSKPDSSPSSHLASPTYELILNNNNTERIGVENDSFYGGENSNSTSCELTKTPNKTSLGDAIKEVVSEPNTPSPINPKVPYHTYTPSPTPSVSYEIEPLKNKGKTVHGNDLVMMLMLLRKLESELEETKKELKELKERESETEIAVASLNAELHKNMSKMAKAEAAEAGKAAAKSCPLGGDDDNGSDGASSRWTNNHNGMIMERSNSEMITKQVDSPTLAEILSITDYDCYFENTNKFKKKMKKKPIIPLITDVFPWRNRSTSSNSYHSASVFSWR